MKSKQRFWETGFFKHKYLKHFLVIKTLWIQFIYLLIYSIFLFSYYCGNWMRKDGFEFSIFWNPCEKILWENPTVQPPQHQGGTSIWGHQRPLRPLCLPMKRPVELWGFTTVGSTVTVCEISPLRQITMDLMFWRMIIKQWPPMQRLKYTQNSSSITLSLGKWVRDIWGTAFRKSIENYSLSEKSWIFYV